MRKDSGCIGGGDITLEYEENVDDDGFKDVKA